MLLHVCFTNLEPDPFVMVIVVSLGQADTEQTLAGTTVGSKSKSCWHLLGADEEIPHISSQLIYTEQSWGKADKFLDLVTINAKVFLEKMASLLDMLWN